MPHFPHMLKTRYKGGEHIREYCSPTERNRQNNFITGLRGIGCRVVHDPNDYRECRIVVDGSSDIPIPGQSAFGGGFQALFNTGPITQTKWTVRRDMVSSGGIYVLGAKYSAALGVDGVTAETISGVQVWSSGELTDDTKQACFLEIDRSTNYVTIVAAESFPSGTAAKYEYTEIVPLWWFGWDDSDDIIDNVIDMRHSVRLPGMA